MAVHKVDRGISRELAAYRIHEPLATALIKEFIKPGMTVVDVGSNIGYYALLESRLVGETGRVMAIEPMAKNAEMLRRNIERNGCTNVDIHELAISNQNGALPMYLSPRSNWHSLLPNPSSKTCMVQVSTLDAFVKKVQLDRVDLVRMDVEGYEIEIIRGMLDVLGSFGPHLLIELHPDLVGSEAIVQYLTTLDDFGYAPQYVFEQERDYPIRWKFLKPERPTMQGLMTHPLIQRDHRALTVFFSRVRVSESRTTLCDNISEASIPALIELGSE